MPMSSPKITRILGFFAWTKELGVEAAKVTATSAAITTGFCLIPVPRTPRAVPTVGIVTIPLRRHVVLLSNLLLNAEFLVTLILRFAANVSHTGALVFVDVEYFVRP